MAIVSVLDDVLRVVIEGTCGLWTLAADNALEFRPEGRVEGFDATQIREQFLQLGSTAEALAFLNQYGCFYVPVADEQSPLTQADILSSINDVFVWQEILKKLMTLPPLEWGTMNSQGWEVSLLGPSQDELTDMPTYVFGGYLDEIDLSKASAITSCRSAQIIFHWTPKNFEPKDFEPKNFKPKKLKPKNLKPWGKDPVQGAVMVAPDILRSMILQTLLDHLKGSKWGFCKRPECGKAYEVDSAHDRFYCDDPCRDLVNQKRKRLKNAKATAKAKKKAVRKRPVALLVPRGPRKPKES